jgi:nicotinamidase/pyrazinamidase
LATDYCVRATAVDARSEGFEVLVLEDACRPVGVPPGSLQKALEEMRSLGVRILRTGDLSA